MKTRLRPARVGRLVLVACGLAAPLLAQCDYSEYPIDPTFCDDWCRVLLRTDCDQEPENCVRNCERSVALEPCFPLQARLLTCYEATPPSEFVCSGQGFRSSARPEEWVCQAERDALIECAYPQVKTCLDVCRAVEASLDAGADAGTDGTTDAIAANDANDASSNDEMDAEMTSSGANANTSIRCPSRDIPCDSICWILGGYFGAPTDGGEPTSAIDAGLGTDDLSGFVSCTIRRSEACWAAQDGIAIEADDAGTGNDGGSEAEAGSSRPDSTWSNVLFNCAEELASET